MKSLVRRVLKRFGYEPVRQRSYFSAAVDSRLTTDWFGASASPTMELWGSLQKIRDRARDLERNNPLVRRYLHLVAENVVGHKGIRLQARNLLPGGRPNTQANAAIEAAFADWHRPEHCTVEGRLSWVGVQQQVVRSVARDGEAFLRLIQGGPYGFALQQFDPELVDETYNRAAGDGKNAIRMGVEVDQWGRAVAYHVFRSYQYDLTGGNRERVRVPAAEIVHLFIPRRPGQTRGESWLAPVMLPLRMLDGYAEAELVAARTAAAKMGFIQRSADNPSADNPDAPAKTDMEAAPGVIDYLDPGDTFQGWDPTHPSGNFGAFVTQVEKIIAGGLNVAYSSLSGDLREVNYSSIRAGLLQERDGWRSLQSWLACHLCETVYRHWREVAWTTGRLSLRMPPQEYRAHVWQPRGWAWIDPEKDVTASAKAVAFGFTSRRRVVGEDGEDFEEILADLAVEQELAAAEGVTLMLPQGVSNGQGEGAGPGNPDEDADGGSGGAARARRGPESTLS